MAEYDFSDFDEPKEQGFDFSDFDVKPEKESSLLSAGRAALQGASAGLSDEFAGLVEGAGRALGVEGAGGKIKDIKLSKEGPTLDWEVLRDAYQKARDIEREALKKGKEENPEAANVAEIAGAVISPVSKIMPGASLAKQGAVVGGLTGFGTSEAEDIVPMTKDVLSGAAFGGVAGKALDVAAPLVQKGVQALGNKAEDLANRMAARAIGAERGTVKKLGLDKVKDIGRYALDNKLLSSDAEEMLTRNEALKSKAGQMMENVYSQIDEAGASTFNPLEVATKVDEQIGGFYRSPINKGETAQLENTLEAILMRGDKPIALKEAQVLKQELGKVAKWNMTPNPTDKELMARDAYRVVSDAIDKATEEGAKSINKEGLSELLSQGKKLYSSAKGAEELLKNKVAREQGNKIGGLTDYIATTGAATSGGAAPAAATFVGKKGLEKYGPKLTAETLDKASKMLLKSPNMQQMMRVNPEAFNALVYKAAEQMTPQNEKQREPQSFNEESSMDALIQKMQGTPYAQMLQNAAQKGEQSFAAANYVLQQRDENYRKKLRGE